MRGMYENAEFLILEIECKMADILHAIRIFAWLVKMYKSANFFDSTRNLVGVGTVFGRRCISYLSKTVCYPPLNLSDNWSRIL